MRFACRMCRKEVTQDSDGVYNHVEDGSPACIVEVAGCPQPDWDRHERVESSSEDVASQLQAEEEVNLKKEGGE